MKIADALYLLLILVGSISCTQPDRQSEKTGIPARGEVLKSKFVGSRSCKSCHETEFRQWQGSHHQLSMLEADSSSVLGDFNDVTFTHKGVKTFFYREDDKYMVNTRAGDGKYYDHEIEYTFGVYPLQQYLVPFPDGAYQCLMVAWDSHENKWFQLQDTLDIAPEEWLHWTGGAMRWNTMCADCHSTDLRKNLDLSSAAYQTTFSEINVGCEGCHGPSSDHVVFYEQENPAGKPPVLYMGDSLSSVEMVLKCARCHSRRSQLTEFFDYTGHFLDHYDPSLITYPIYEADGQILDEDYVYASFIQSKMYGLGISCRDCHNVHSLKLKAEGNALCMSCHLPKYDTPEHHFHQVKTEASQCVSCHMTGRTYMGNDFRRDHSFRIPRPDQTAMYGTPNACNGCHSDKSAQWAADEIVKRFGPDRADHFSDHLLAGFHGDKEALERLIAGAQYPEIARATAITYYTDLQLSDEDVEELKAYLKSSGTLIRNETVRSLDKIGVDFSGDYSSLLADPMRIVRMSTVRRMIMGGHQQYDNSDFVKALAEYQEALDLNSDFPSGQQNIALYHQANGEIQKAIDAYRKAIKMDNYANQARMNLALLLYQKGQPEESEQLYLKVIEQEPDYGYTYYMLGLLYNETGKIEKAVSFLEEACERDPANIRAFYNYALILQKTGDLKKSVQVIDRALMSVPNNEQLLYVKLVGQMNGNDYHSAKETCSTLISIAPQNNDYRQAMEIINSRISNR